MNNHWKVPALSLATTLAVAYISCAIFDALFPPFGLIAALAPASPLPLSGSPLGYLTGLALFTGAGFVLGAFYGIASEFWSNRIGILEQSHRNSGAKDCGEMTSWVRSPEGMKTTFRKPDEH